MKRRAFTIVELLVVTSIVLLLAGIIVTVLVSAKTQGKRSSSISNLRQLGLAGQLYQETYGDFPDSVIRLLDAGMAPKEVVLSPEDPYEKGLGNVFEKENYQSFTLPYTYKPEIRKTYVGYSEAQISKFMRREWIKTEYDGGWLVDLVPGTKKDEVEILFTSGMYNRLLLDGSVQKKIHVDDAAPKLNGLSAKSPALWFFDRTPEYDQWVKNGYKW